MKSNHLRSSKTFFHKQSLTFDGHLISKLIRFHFVLGAKANAKSAAPGIGSISRDFKHKTHCHILVPTKSSKGRHFSVLTTKNRIGKGV